MTTVLILNPTDHWQQEENQCVVTPDVSSHGKIDVQRAYLQNVIKMSEQGIMI